MLHDACGTLAADHTPIDRVIPVTLDVTNATVLQMHLDPAPTRAHVARGRFDLVADGEGERYLRLDERGS